MRIFDCPNCNRQQSMERARQSGFTLIEILVVLLIVTMLAGLTIARLPGFVSTADIDLESRRLKLLFNLAHNEAMLDSSEFGFRLSDGGYEFLVFDDGSRGWLPAESPFQSRRLHEDLDISVKADNKGLKLLGAELPPVLILSSGETTPFTLTLSSKVSAEQRRLTADGYGEFAWDADQ